ncbi:MAG: hypothetical protein IPK13_10585 [Deltaproteobacteria bacterium]|nr:hypothetical protein [Deltaproteobacteria bacterium]
MLSSTSKQHRNTFSRLLTGIVGVSNIGGAASVVGIVGLLASGCGGKDDPNDSAGGRDGGTSFSGADAQLADCASNPNQCVVHALMSSAPSCSCLTSAGTPLCEAGYVYSATQQACILTLGSDAGGSSADAAPLPGPDAGGNTGADAGTSVDSGAGDASNDTAECSSDSECASIPNGQCASPSAASVCNGTCTDGLCIEACDWTQGPTGQCSDDGRCVYGGTSIDGLCTPDEGGKGIGESCKRTFDAQGNATSDECNQTLNLVCFGATATNPNGQCAAICSVAQNPPGYCGTLGMTCLPVTDTLGVCGEIPTWTDTGKACTTAASCQDSTNRICETSATGGTCSSDCAQTACPADSICVGVSETGPFFCVLDCSDNATTCANRNASLQCYALEDNVSVCAP